MNKAIRSQLVLAILFSVACAVSFAQSSGEATFKTKCAMCHGPAGAAETPTAKMLKVKPVSDPAIKALTVDQIIATIKNGKGKMKPITGLTDPQIKDVAAFYKSLK